MLKYSIRNLGIGISRKVVKRDTPGGLISPLLWNMVVNKIIFELNYKVVAYVDDAGFLIKGKFVSSINEHMESGLSTLLKWAKENRLGYIRQIPNCAFFSFMQEDFR